MTTENTNTVATQAPSFISSENLLKEWLGHRRLTRRVIDAFPEEPLFNFSIGGMRTFADMTKEIIDLGGPGMKGLATGEWPTEAFNHSAKDAAPTKEALLALFDKGTEEIVTYFSQISEDRFQEKVLAFGMYEGLVFSTVLYFIDNEIHHRAQGTVYLRSLGIEPPAFWNRD